VWAGHLLAAAVLRRRMSTELADIREHLEKSRRQRGPIPALQCLFDAVDGLISYLEEQESYAAEMKERE
jgi:hypothetical protein